MMIHSYINYYNQCKTILGWVVLEHERQQNNIPDEKNLYTIYSFIWVIWFEYFVTVIKNLQYELLIPNI